MNQMDLKNRTKVFALQIIALVESLPATIAGRTMGSQLIRCGTSVGANYRAACRARSKAEFNAKLGIVIEEADETTYWLELLADAGILSSGQVQPLLTEANQLTAIFVASRKTAVESSIINHRSSIGDSA